MLNHIALGVVGKTMAGCAAARSGRLRLFCQPRHAVHQNGIEVAAAAAGQSGHALLWLQPAMLAANQLTMDLHRRCLHPGRRGPGQRIVVRTGCRLGRYRTPLRRRKNRSKCGGYSHHQCLSRPRAIEKHRSENVALPGPANAKFSSAPAHCRKTRQDDHQWRSTAQSE